ncbi:unnamed protein product [Prorocentrum cordatum]|uniref:Uncharacterized protein n=1 Tax=Prorocentrum cordatum TaxID=2364126 RepID=A0ABN9WIM7_9DINO|nr:unnamed protein product [Polarella glacialis]
MMRRGQRERERELGGPTAPWACGRDGAESACGLLQAAKRACTVSFPGAVGDPRRREEGGREGGREEEEEEEEEDGSPKPFGETLHNQKGLRRATKGGVFAPLFRSSPSRRRSAIFTTPRGLGKLSPFPASSEVSMRASAVKRAPPSQGQGQLVPWKKNNNQFWS